MLIGLGILAATCALITGMVFAATNVWQNLGAQAVDLGRAFFGDKIMADVENLLLTTEDRLKRIKYNVTKAQPVVPWQSDTLPSQGKGIAPASTGMDVPAQPKVGRAWALANLPPQGDISREGQ